MSLLTDIVAAIEEGNTESIPAEVLRTFSHFRGAVEREVAEELSDEEESAETADQTEDTQENND